MDQFASFYEASCRFEFSVADIDDAEFYSIEVADRGEVVFSREDLEANDWLAELTISD